MQPANPTRIAIIGAGASGSLLAVQLCRLAGGRPLDIILFDKTETAGPGLAYSTPDPLHLLNVPAAKMSAFPDQPGHFLNWLQQNGHGHSGDDFVPRHLYGSYLSAILADALSAPPLQVQIRLVTQEVLKATPVKAGTELTTANGSVFAADKVVLALGNFPPAHPCNALAQLPPDAPYAPNPWQQAIFEQLHPEATVLLVGTGLTMVDVLTSLQERSHRGAILAVSTHGHLPTVHQKTEPYAGVTAEVAQVACVKEWLRYIRQHVQLARQQGIGWRAVVDAFRPYSQAFWLQLSLAEKRRFMRHLRHIWAVSRHRMPPKSAAVVQQLLETKQLTVKAARVTKATLRNGRAEITIRYSITHKTEEVTAGLVVNCTGPEADLRKVNLPLLQDLLGQGLVVTDALYMGFAAEPNGRLLTAQHQPSDTFFSLGPPLKGVLWESTAIPEIREQARNLARLLLKENHA